MAGRKERGKKLKILVGNPATGAVHATCLKWMLQQFRAMGHFSSGQEQKLSGRGCAAVTLEPCSLAASPESRYSRGGSL